MWIIALLGILALICLIPTGNRFMSFIQNIMGILVFISMIIILINVVIYYFSNNKITISYNKDDETKSTPAPAVVPLQTAAPLPVSSQSNINGHYLTTMNQDYNGPVVEIAAPGGFNNGVIKFPVCESGLNSPCYMP